ncbi:hypothetical protein EDC01DRAFT_189096 [Geopyxis carbonaria]|nr:hypothetical protein EDC01DRAFT_189096 [Geopyxis carbonaria]
MRAFQLPFALALVLQALFNSPVAFHVKSPPKVKPRSSKPLLFIIISRKSGCIAPRSKISSYLPGCTSFLHALSWLESISISLDSRGQANPLNRTSVPPKGFGRLTSKHCESPASPEILERLEAELCDLGKLACGGGSGQ